MYLLTVDCGAVRCVCSAAVFLSCGRADPDPEIAWMPSFVRSFVAVCALLVVDFHLPSVIQRMSCLGTAGKELRTADE